MSADADRDRGGLESKVVWYRPMFEVESKVSNPNQAGTKTRIPAGWLRFLFWRMTISIF